MTDAQLRSLLLDCLKLWEVAGKVTVGDSGVAIKTADGVFMIKRAEPDLRPLRWFYQTPERASARRPPRAAPSIVALLSALRNAMAGAGGDRLRIGGGLDMNGYGPLLAAARWDDGTAANMNNTSR